METTNRQTPDSKSPLSDLLKAQEIVPEKFLPVIKFMEKSIKFIAEKRSGKEESRVVDALTPWELFLSSLNKKDRGVIKEIRTNTDSPINPTSMAKVALLWMMKNKGKYQNQPFLITLSPDKKYVDPRKKTDNYQAAIRQENGTYLVLKINKSETLNISNEKLFKIVRNSSRDPNNCQVVVDNRSVQNAFGWELNEQIPSAFIGIAQNEEGVITLNTDHLCLDGSAVLSLAHHLGHYSKTSKDQQSQTKYPTENTKFQPQILINKFAPSLLKLSNTQIMKVFAETMISLGKDPQQTILIPTVGKFNSELDNFLEKNPTSHSRIQPAIFALEQLANQPDYVRSHLNKISDNLNEEVLTHLFKILNHPSVPEKIKNIFLKKLKHVPYLKKLVAIFNGVGLVTLPKQLKISHDQDYGKTRDNVSIFGNTMKSMVDEIAINLTRYIFDDKITFSLSGNKSKADIDYLENFAKIMENFASKLLN
ncbi:MAG: hypothetical protein U9Q63_02175 [Patescibacteria group bacterium]|nr:hypothetical protein [Patescibacteria group bacterium]